MSRTKLGWTAFSALLTAAVLLPTVIRSQQPAASPPAGASRAVTAKAVDAANAFLATLSPAERAKGTFGFNSSQRTGWSNLPSGVFQRNGLRLGDLTPEQRSAAMALVAAVLSREGTRR